MNNLIHVQPLKDVLCSLAERPHPSCMFLLYLAGLAQRGAFLLLSVVLPLRHATVQGPVEILIKKDRYCATSINVLFLP